MLIIFSLIPKSIDCYEAYNEFIDYYNLSQKIDIVQFQQFCFNYKRFLKIKHTCSECIVTKIFDRDLSKMKGFLLPNQKEQSGSTRCQQIMCFAEDPLPTLSNIPDSVDLRESGLVTTAKDQKQCGSCWAFATISLLENVVLRDQKVNKIETFARSAKELDLSDQFLLSNTFGFSNYCQGGDGVTALNFMIDNYDIWPTIEIEQNYPYDQRKYENDFMKKIPLKPILKQDQFYLPYQSFERVDYNPQEGTPKTPVVILQDHDYVMIQEQVKQYLARGIAVLAVMNTQTSYNSDIILSSYNGRYALDGFPCSGTTDHQVIIVGYGEFKGTPVWIVKNSWGSSWGNQGHMYIARGSNQFCIEKYAYAIIPNHYNPDDGVFTQKYETPYIFNEFTPGLDKTVISNDQKPYNLKEIVIIVAVITAVILVITMAVFIIVKVRKLRGKHVEFQ